ncbi:hypothetical protein POL68_13445 [Stigmatella sp. ncwal1]|uniref:Uncharacterized protein n=1 Tax=Stigmatella ashevillensis TaxID=2995309 RepID=A0ABT5D729_9BACT|nr:hypothetical protein [Stigmatella ashevillena]MDC0709470.1 hypothetical protein [Stigmatella ashevillena]
MLRHAIVVMGMFVVGASLLPATAEAQPVLIQRCAADSLNFAQIQQRIELVRWCALTRNVHAPDWTCPSDYSESNANTNPLGKNAYLAPSGGINATYINLLYLSGGISYMVDADGYCKWSKPVSRQKMRPLYPVYGSQADLTNPNNRQLFFHPTQFSCTLYLDKNGTQPATGYDFYINGFCESA